jgi:hypothetical protein
VTFERSFEVAGLKVPDFHGRVLRSGDHKAENGRLKTFVEGFNRSVFLVATYLEFVTVHIATLK